MRMIMSVVSLMAFIRDRIVISRSKTGVSTRYAGTACFETTSEAVTRCCTGFSRCEVKMRSFAAVGGRHFGNSIRDLR